jgi:hypothetical protein
VSSKAGWGQRVLIWFDIFVNIFGLRSRSGITISSRAQTAADQGKGWGIKLTAFLNLFEREHGYGAIIGDINRALDMLEELKDYHDLPLPQDRSEIGFKRPTSDDQGVEGR